MTNKEINRAIASLIEEPELYDIRYELKPIIKNVTLRFCSEYVAGQPDSHLYTYTTSEKQNYSSDLNLATKAAKQIANTQYTFVLSIEDNQYKAAFGDFKDCVEFKDENPAYATCMSVIKFMKAL
jgi:hypothetical protein